MAHPIVAIEGVVGVGKSTLIESLCSTIPHLQPMRLPASFRALRRSLATTPDESPVAHLGYYLAATAELGTAADQAALTGPVVLDRYFPSPVGLFDAAGWLDADTARELAAPFVAASPPADVTVVLTASHDAIRERIQGRIPDDEREQAIHERCRRDEPFAMAWQTAIEVCARQFGPADVVDTADLTAQNVTATVRYLLETRTKLDR